VRDAHQAAAAHTAIARWTALSSVSRQAGWNIFHVRQMPACSQWRGTTGRCSSHGVAGRQAGRWLAHAAAD
jgi:hypothetical protein